MRLRTTAALLAVLLLSTAAGRASAQDDGAAPEEGAPGEDAPPPSLPAAGPAAPMDPSNPGAGPAPSASRAPEHQDEGPEVTQADARANAATLIQSFLAKHSVDGAFPLRDKTTKKLRRLTLVKVDEKDVEPAGGARYTAPAWLKDEATGQKLEAAFTLDFTPPDWKVVGLRLKPPAPAPATSSPAESARKGR